MRWLWALLSAPVLATVAEAHGGSFGHGPPVIVQRGIPCDCGMIECDKCADEPLRRGDDVRISTPTVTQGKRWADVARCRVEVTFEALPDRGLLEAYARVEPGPLFAAVAGNLPAAQGGEGDRVGGGAARAPPAVVSDAPPSPLAAAPAQRARFQR
jgi:hypothetical protein